MMWLLFACADPPAAKPAPDGDSSPPADSGEPADDSAAPPVEDTAAWPSPGKSCGLVHDLASTWFTEGDTVHFTVACSGDLATADARISVVRLPGSARFDGDTLSFDWSTGPADGGRIDLVFSVSPADDPDAVPAAETVSFWVADNPDSPDNIPVDPTTYTEEWGLPVLHIDYEGTLDASYIPASVVSGGDTYPATIKVRGASSYYYDKKSFTLEFDAEELPIPAWGVTRDHLILLSTFDDNSYVRQKLVYDLWAAMAAYWGQPRLTPRSYFTVVYLEGAYHGLYVALDRIDDEFMDQMGFDRESDLYKAVNHDANFYATNASGYTKSTLHDGYTKEEGEETGFDELDNLVNFTANSDAATLIAGAPAWFDLGEMMDWFLLVHYANSEDSAGKNAYFAKVPQAGLFRYVPWDHNHAWGQGWYTYRIESGYLNNFTWNNRIFWAIQDDPEAQLALWDRYRQMRADGPFDPAFLEGLVDGYYAAIEPSAARDWAKWDDAYYAYGGWASTRDAYGDWTDYQGEKAYLRRWMADRAALFEANHL